jgi:MFS family permease
MLATSTTMLSLGTPAEWRGATIGLSAGANAAGQALGQIGGSTIASTLGIRSVFLVTASTLALVCAAVTLGVKEPEPIDDDDSPYLTHAPVGTVATPARPRQAGSGAGISAGTPQDGLTSCTSQPVPSGSLNEKKEL